MTDAALMVIVLGALVLALVVVGGTVIGLLRRWWRVTR